MPAAPRDHCDARRHAEGRTSKTTATSTAKAELRFLPLPLPLPLLGLWLLLVPLPPIAWRRASQRSEGATGMDAGRAMPGHGWPVSAVPRRAREAQGIGGRLLVLRRYAGRAFFGYFLCAPKKVTRAPARNSALRLSEQSRDSLRDALRRQESQAAPIAPRKAASRDPLNALLAKTSTS